MERDVFHVHLHLHHLVLLLLPHFFLSKDFKKVKMEEKHSIKWNLTVFYIVK